MKAVNFRLAFIAACITDISGCSAIAPVDDYMTTHNLYGNLCKEFLDEAGDAAPEQKCSGDNCAGVDSNLNEGSIQNEKEEDVNQEEAL